MSIINTGVFYPKSRNGATARILLIGVPFAVSIAPSSPLSIKPTAGAAIQLTGLSSSGNIETITISGQGETGTILLSKELVSSNTTGGVGKFLISQGYGQSDPSIGQSSIPSFTFATDEELLIIPADTANLVVTYNEVVII